MFSASRSPPPSPLRSLSSSTASTLNSASRSASSSQTTIPLPSTSSPSTSSPGLGPPMQLSPSPQSSVGTLTGSQSMAGDDVDKWGYIYSLRVAALHQHLLLPSRRSSASNLLATPQAPVQSPTLSGTSPNGSRLTFSSLSPSGAPKTPEIPTPDVPPTRRKSSGFSLSFGKDKDEAKLPKDFLLEFWGVLVAAEGDLVWKQAVKGFITLIEKKGTKTAAGANMREIPTLLETFSSCITGAPSHVHQSRFLQLLYDSLASCSYFATRSHSDKDKDLLFRLRAEVQSFMLMPVDAASEYPLGALPSRGSSNGGSPSSRVLSSPIGLGRAIPLHDDGKKRKPSPVYVPEGPVGYGDMVDTVGMIWGVPKDMLQRDLANGWHSTPEKLYLIDLKRGLSTLSALPPPLSGTQRARQAALSASLTELLSRFPDLALPSSPAEFGSPSASETLGAGPFFVPPRKGEVFARLVRRATEGSVHGARTRELVDRCRSIWGIESRVEKEREVEFFVQRWGSSLGTPEEIDCGKSLAESVRDLCSVIPVYEPLPPVLDHLHVRLLSLLSSSVGSIFPTTSLPPPPPPPSVLPILLAAPDHFIYSPHASAALGDVADEVRGAAVGEYVAAAGEMMGGVSVDQVGIRTADSGKDAVVEGFEKVAEWIEREVSNVLKVWGKGLGSVFNPPALIVARQLPLFLAELQVLEQVSGSASDIFTLYEVTARLLNLWDDLCPGTDHGFEIDNFFEPHVLTWLRETEVNETHQWVSRAVGMDSWVPEGENKHSQSVIDLFEFIRGSAQVILHELPLSEYKRAIFLIDLSKTASIAVSQYASTVQALFMNDLSSAKIAPTNDAPPSQLGGKAGAWLAKGKQAVQKLERRKVDGFVIPPAACVKLTDMGAAQVCLEDLSFAMEAEDTARIVREHRLSGAPAEKPIRNVFTVTIHRGENLLTRGSIKPADAFVTITDKESGERLFKSRTILGAEDPKWEQAFEVTVGSFKSLELLCFDRQLVGKHDQIGSATFKLDPRAFADIPVRDIVLPMTPRGIIHLRITMEGGEKNDVQYHLNTAGRMLERAARDMSQDIVDRLGDFIRSQLSFATLASLTKPLKDKKKIKTALSDEDINSSLNPLYDYFNDNFSVFSVTLTYTTRLELMLVIWRRVVEILISLLIPPLSDKPCTTTPLSAPEIDIVFKWLQTLKAFFNASEGGVEHGIPLAQLQSGNYKDIIMLGQYLDLPTPSLRERAAAAVKAAASSSATANLSPKAAMRNLSLGGVVAPASRSRVDEDSQRMAEILLRIARTRPDMSEFLQHQLATLIRAKVERQGGVL